MRDKTRRPARGRQHCRAVPPIARQGHAKHDPERGEGISQGIYYKWSKDFMEAGKKRLAGDTARAANTDEVKDLRREARDLKEVVAEQTLELRLLKKSMTGDGGYHE
jgi:transposase-like protein